MLRLTVQRPDSRHGKARLSLLLICVYLGPFVVALNCYGSGVRRLRRSCNLRKGGLKATPMRPQSHILGIYLGVQSHPKATPKRQQSANKATPDRAKSEVRGPKSEGNPKTEGRKKLLTMGWLSAGAVRWGSVCPVPSAEHADRGHESFANRRQRNGDKAVKTFPCPYCSVESGYSRNSGFALLSVFGLRCSDFGRPRLPRSHPQATLKLPRGYPEATPRLP